MATQHDKTDLASLVDKTLDVLGGPAKTALYYHLEKSYGMRIEPGEPMVPVNYLQRALISLLGHGAAEAIIERISKD